MSDGLRRDRQSTEPYLLTIEGSKGADIDSRHGIPTTLDGLGSHVTDRQTSGIGNARFESLQIE